MKLPAILVSFAVCLLSPPVALSADMPKGALCALVDIQECLPGATCERVSAEEISVPVFIRVEIAERTLRGVGPRGRDRVTKMGSVDQRGETIYALGVDDEIQGKKTALGWVLALGVKDGSMKLTVTGEDVTFVAAGECLLDN